MITGVGTDFISVERIKSIIEKRGEQFLTRIFTPQEIEYCRSKKSGADRCSGEQIWQPVHCSGY